jgi:hypothetical protein
MLVTGRRTCELLNGSSEFSITDAPEEYALFFKGQAKRRGNACVPYRIPVLAPPTQVLQALSTLRVRQDNYVAATNRECSRRYQSLLSRAIHEREVWKACGRVHGLRGIYAVMCLRLFDWTSLDGDDPSDAYITMHILGHASVEESLAYTSFSLESDFASECHLGVGRIQRGFF